MPVLAPEGTAARPRVPSARMTSTSTVGLPRLSRISRPRIAAIRVDGAGCVLIVALILLVCMASGETENGSGPDSGRPQRVDPVCSWRGGPPLTRRCADQWGVTIQSGQGRRPPRGAVSTVSVLVHALPDRFGQGARRACGRRPILSKREGPRPARSEPGRRIESVSARVGGRPSPHCGESRADSPRQSGLPSVNLRERSDRETAGYRRCVRQSCPRERSRCGSPAEGLRELFVSDKPPGPLRYRRGARRA